MDEIGGALRKAKDISQNRVKVARDFQKEGRKIIGYPCAYVPTEMVSALNFVPYRIYASIKEVVTEADRGLPVSFCSIMRSCLDCALKGYDDFLDGIVAIHSCDPQEKTLRVWESYSKSTYFHFIDLPATVRPEVMDYFKGQLKDFKKTLEDFSGEKISPEQIRTAIRLHNQQRSMIQELYGLTRSDPPLISGTEILEITKAIMSLPVVKGNELLRLVIEEVKRRPPAPGGIKPRLLIWTSTLDDPDLMKMIEERSYVVIDDNCAGLRPFHGQIELTDDPIDGLADHYLKDIFCARTFWETHVGETKKDFRADLQSRFGYLKDRVQKWKVRGAILFLVRYCDPFAFEMMELKDYFDGIGLPNTYIEYEYYQGGLAPVRTRIEAFLETLG